MTKIVRWSPMREMMTLRNEFDRLFDTAFEMPRWNVTRDTTWGLAVDVTEDENEFTVTAAVPGLAPEDIDITVNNNMLTIQGEYADESEKEEKQYHVRERRFGSFSRSLTLPSTVDTEQIAAEYEKGVLTLRIPKAEVAKPRRVAVKVSNGDRVLEG